MFGGIHKIFLRELPVLIALLSSGCIFGPLLDVGISKFDDGSFNLFISTNSDNVTLCNNELNSSRFTCIFDTADEQGHYISDIILTGADLAILRLLDPLVLQLPAAAGSFAGSYLHRGSDTSGNLVITAGLTSLKADATHTLTADPGMQFVVIELPDDAPIGGNFAFNFNFRLPPNTTDLQVKAMLTGRARVAGETFYLPSLPCTTNWDAVPTFLIPLPAGGQVTLPISGVQGCDNVQYRLAAATLGEKVYLPLIRN